MPVTINGSGTMAGLNANGISAQPVFSGQVLQVVQGSKTDTFTTASTSYVDVTGLSVTITPRSATSNILVMVSTNYSNVALGQNGMFQLVRGSTAIGIGAAAGTRSTASAQTRIQDGNAASTIAINFLDSPATTSATTYKIQMKVQGDTGCVNRTNSDTDSPAIARTASSIIVMEIAG
jgi:hypothetical protein